MSEALDDSGPDLCPGNPGVAAAARFGFANGEKAWSEEVDLVELAAAVLEKHGHSVSRHKQWLGIPASGFVILPRLVDMRPTDKGSAHTTSTIQVHHPVLVPGGVFEYQHSFGNTAEESLRIGFDQWAKVDFVSFQDAALDKPRNCSFMVGTFPEKDGAPPRSRRAILGPVAHFMANPPPQPAVPGEGDEHSFCPCCLLTRTFPAHKQFFEGDGFFGLRFFAARNQNGEPQADCRVNGEDWEPGAEALREYVRTWPGTGYEFRKQYVILQTVDNPKGSPP
jgi:hypothetical protein